jgi:dienelactone hydrolase
MAEVLLFHHALGLTPGVKAFADELRRAGHTVHTPDLYGGRTFSNIEEGVAFGQKAGVMQSGEQAASKLPSELVYAGFSLGVMPAQKLAQTQPGARGALFFEAFIPVAEFGSWPAGLPAQVHGMDKDPFFALEGDIDAARAFTEATDNAELFVYPGDQHLFADSSLPSYRADAAALLKKRVLEFLAKQG